MRQIIYRLTTRKRDGLDLPVVLYPGDDGYIIAEVPALPGCVSQGKTEKEALAKIKGGRTASREHGGGGGLDPVGQLLHGTYSENRIECLNCP